jgi:bifunctional non-homologous end joining protein LigD
MQAPELAPFKSTLPQTAAESTFQFVLRASIFVPACEPIQRDRPPKGDAWLHEVKFDGYRRQLHKAGHKVWLFTRNGHDWTERFPLLAAELAALPACIIDGSWWQPTSTASPTSQRSSAP